MNNNKTPTRFLSSSQSTRCKIVNNPDYKKEHYVSYSENLPSPPKNERHKYKNDDVDTNDDFDNYENTRLTKKRFLKS